MTFPTLSGLHLPESWAVTDRPVSRTRTEYVLRPPDSEEVIVIVERCGSGRLAEAYPVGTHDIEVQVSAARPGVLTLVLQQVAAAAQQDDPLCRRVVFAAPVRDLSVIAAAEQAGFRYVIDVDIPDGSVCLLVVEPAWVTRVDMDLDRVPQS
jgi:hypothetical protein